MTSEARDIVERLEDLATIERRELFDAMMDAAEEIRRLREALKYAKPFVERWCHTQGNNVEFHRETLVPIEQALSPTGD